MLFRGACACADIRLNAPSNVVAPGIGVAGLPIVVSVAIIRVALPVIEWILFDGGIDQRGNVVEFFVKAIGVKRVFEVFADVEFVHAFILGNGEEFVCEGSWANGLVSPIVDVAVCDIAESPLYAPSIVHIIR